MLISSEKRSYTKLQRISFSKTEDEDQKSFIRQMNKFIDGRSSTEIIQAARFDVENLFGVHSNSSFTNDVINLFATEKLPSLLKISTSTAKLNHYLKVSIP